MAQAWYDGPIWRGFLWTPRNRAGHSGVDIGVPIGTPLTALLPGQVISLGMEPWAGQVNVQSDYPGIGPIVVTYLHGSAFPRGMTAGKQVLAGEVIMFSGQPPPGGKYGSGAHVHFEVNTGYQPPYMGFQGPPAPINPMFLIEAAKNGTLGDVGTAMAGTLAQSTNQTTQSGLIENLGAWLGLPTFSIGTGAVTRAPLSPGFLGVVEGIDEAEDVPGFDASNVLGWAVGTFEAVMVRTTIVLLGVLIVFICIWNALQPMLKAETEVAGPLITGLATKGAAL